MKVSTVWSCFHKTFILTSKSIHKILITCNTFVGTNPGGGSTYYYGENRYHARFVLETREIEKELPQMTAIDSEDRPSVRTRLSRNSGYTGLSILHRLYKLYKFDVFKDLVYDVTHNIPLNVAARQIKNWIDSEAIDKDVVEQRLRSFPWTAGW